ANLEALKASTPPRCCTALRKPFGEEAARLGLQQVGVTGAASAGTARHAAGRRPAATGAVFPVGLAPTLQRAEQLLDALRLLLGRRGRVARETDREPPQHRTTIIPRLIANRAL